MEKSAGRDIFEFWNGMLEQAVPFFKNWYIASKYQKDILDNYKDILNLNQFLQLAPYYLWQSINQGWSFSLMNFTKQLKGSPALEYKIVTEVAGYGSQLGTIIDYLEVVDEEYRVDPDKLKDNEAKYKYYKFHDLVGKLKKAREDALTSKAPVAA